MAFDLYLRGRSAMRELDDPQVARIAAGHFARAAELDPDFALAHAEAARALTHAWHAEREAALIERARAFADRALELDDELPEARLAAARLDVLAGRPLDAISRLAPLAAGERAIDEIHRALAEAWEAAGDFAQSEEHLLAAISARPASWQHWNMLGDHRLRHGNLAGARAAFTRAAELAPAGATTPAENLASLLFYEGKLAEAMKAYEAISEPVANAASASNLGTLYYFNRRFGDAERHFRRAIRLAPRDPVYRRNLADALLRLDRNDEARNEYAEALRLVEEQLEVAPGDADLMVQRTLYLARAGRCEDALAAADELQGRLQESPQLLHRLARPAALCNQPDRALERLQAAVALGASPELLANEDELASLRSLPEFQALVARPAAR
jgi:Flp pilus assembly protein TadD